MFSSSSNSSTHTTITDAEQLDHVLPNAGCSCICGRNIMPLMYFVRLLWPKAYFSQTWMPAIPMYSIFASGSLHMVVRIDMFFSILYSAKALVLSFHTSFVYLAVYDK